MAETMRAVDIHNGAGPASSLYINSSTPTPTPKLHDALVKIKYFGLNRMDLLQREGHYPVPPQAPKTLGVEFSGVIAALGEKANQNPHKPPKIDSLPKETSNYSREKEWEIGDEVFGLAYGGAYAEYIAVSTHMLMHKPTALSWEQAAGVPETWMTATQALYLVGGFSAGKSVLWHAGASSVSIAGIQLSKAERASKIFVTAGSQEKIDFCVDELGASKGFNYHTQDWAKEVLRETEGRGVDIVVDFVGATYFQGNLNVAARDGRIVHLGAMGGTRLPAGVDIGGFVRKRLRFEGSSLRSRGEVYQGRLRDMVLEHAVARMCRGEFKVVVERVFGWEEIVKAHELMESNKTKGKIVCKVD